ncbi:MAG: ABC transporter ATP-binding protein [Streptosporangiaceae bacterium]|nr:ABC transporter ATP-binding protein [Streptosporangiaceae bacterium]
MPGATAGLREVTRVYRPAAGHQITALDSVSLQIEPGSAVAVTGPSGSGKSTLLHLIGAMDRPDAGQIEVDGVRVDRLSRRELDTYRRRTGFIFQQFHLLPVLTALDNVIAPVLPRPADFDKVARARELLAAVGLAGRERSVPGELSGGEQQRVGIARSLIARPRLLLADEPTGNLDSSTGREIIELLLSLRRSHGTTLLIATHDIEVAACCDRAIALHDGRVASDDQLDGKDPAGLLDRIGQLRPDG